MHKLTIVFILLVIILLIKQFIESGYFHTIQNIINEKHIKNSIEQTQFQKELNNIISNTQQKINKAVEQGYIEAFENKQDTGYLTSYINKNNLVKIQLFYKPSCKYCNDFMPIWTQIINNLPNNATYEEINTDIDLKSTNQNKITSVPTIILLIDNEKHIYIGNRTYNDINRFLRTYGVNLIQRKFEDFLNNGYSNEPETTMNSQNKNCPDVSFDKQIDLENDTYMYQIFNSNGQYGYAIGGYNNDKILKPFMAAYSTVDSYLSSLPDENEPHKNSYKNINECANLYANNIINFGLCDSQQLDNILEYQTKINSGEKQYRINNTDYTTNNNVVNAIKKVCGFTN
jgi:thiol-disulfide isomerase/thioredoxin